MIIRKSTCHAGQSCAAWALRWRSRCWTAWCRAGSDSARGRTPAREALPCHVRRHGLVAEFDELFNKVSNWGRWGKDDQIGAMNLLTEAKRR